tara:strand:+ start:109 stop:291 length:183 start_codon:yes stop_codon:yes gene_type:complete
MGNVTLTPVKTEFCQYYYVGFTKKELEYILSDPNDKMYNNTHDIEKAIYPDSSYTILIGD